MIRCKHCRRLVPTNPRLKEDEQKYCGAKACQQARKNQWRIKQRKVDQEYRQAEQESRDKWKENNPDYKPKRSGSKEIKKALVKPALAQHTSVPQSPSETDEDSKRDALESFFNGKTIRCEILPNVSPSSGRRDALVVEIVPISMR